MEKPLPQIIERCVRPMIGANGKRLGRVEVYRELTARRLFDSKMAQAEKLASLGQRVTGIVHELSNPLTSILGNAQRLILRDEAGGQSAEAHRILEEATRASTILRQLLFVSREARPERRLVSLNELVDRTADLQRAALAGSGLRLSIEIPEQLPKVEGDFGQLQQVLLNLLQNARQAIEESGSGSLIGIRVYTRDPGRVRLEVLDDGPGIPQTLQARIFDPFFTTKSPDKGTGLGLAIVSGIVRQHGGTVMLTSALGEGARFTVELPVARHFGGITPALSSVQNCVSGAPVPTLTRDAANTDGTSGTPHVLVVEDEPTVGVLIADVLREDGFHVDVLPDAEKGLEAARQRRYDLAICGMHMPGMDGHLFYSALSETKNPLREHILFVTGDVVAQRTQEFLERYNLPHLAKPLRVEELCLAVRSTLNGSPANIATRHEYEHGLGNWMRHEQG